MKVQKWTIIFSLLTLSVAAQNNPPWKTYYDSTQLFWAKDWNKTVQLLENAEHFALSDLGAYHQNYLTILNDLGTAYWKAKDYPRAEQTLKRSLDLKSEVFSQNDKEVILSLNNLAGLYAERGDWAKSKSLYQKILKRDTDSVRDDVYVSAAQSLVSLYDLNHQADSADMWLRRIAQWDIIAADTFLAFQYRFFRAKTHRKLKAYREAQAELDELMRLLQDRDEQGMRELYIEAIQEQGILFLETGAYSRAEKTLLQAYSLGGSVANGERLLTEVSNTLAQVYDRLHIYDKALLYYRESLDRCKALYDEDALPCVILKNNIAGINLSQENFTAAIEGYEKVVVEFQNLLRQTDPLYVTSLNNLATAYRNNDQWKKARVYLEKAWTLLQKNGAEKSDLASAVLNNMAVLSTAEGDYHAAARSYEEAYDIKRTIYGDNSILLIDLINNLAVTYWALNRPEEAIPLLKKSMELSTRQITYVFPSLNENEQIQFYQKLKEDFERFNTMAVQWAGRDGDLLARMFGNRTAIKSLQFFTQQRRMRRITSRKDPELNALVTQLKDRHERLGRLYQLPLDDLGDGSDIAALEKEIDRLEKSISLKSSEVMYAGLTAEEVDWRSMIPELKSNEAIVEMVRFRKYDRQKTDRKEFFGFADSVYYAALIVTSETKAQPQLVLFKDGNNLETRFYNYYKNAMAYNVADSMSYDFFWAPVAKVLEGKSRIYFSADGVYHRINLNTLRTPRGKQFLLEKYDIVYLLNPIQFLENKASLKKGTHDAVLMGDPVFDGDLTTPQERSVNTNHFGELPGTAQELRAINSLLKTHAWNTRLYLKGAATESNLKSVHSPAILHIASHGFFSSDMVTLNSQAKKEFLFHSGIVLTGANKSIASGSTAFQNDGIVTAFEVMNLDLSKTHLVVLSACETGLGKIENGEGVFGLQRSFMQAGARNVLISLWKVDDNATRDLMIKFYSYLAMGSSMHDSLKRAQSDLAKVYPDPSCWGGFVLVGNN